MGIYFALDLEGRGTKDVESLGSFLNRSAYIHGVTTWQFMRHLASHDQRRGAKPFPEYLLYAESLAICNYGDDLSRLVELVEKLTDLSGLRASTFLCLRGVLTRKGSGVVKGNRAWCPACWIEMQYEGRQLYEKLQWSARYITRCVDHKIQLESSCPRCERLQRYFNGISEIGTCQFCSASLIAPHAAWIEAPRASVGERDVVDLIEWAASTNETIASDAIARFTFELRARKYERQQNAAPLRHIGALKNREGCAAKPSLTRCIGLATEHDVLLLTILTCPEEAAAISSLEISGVPQSVVVMKRVISKGEREKIRDQIVEIINDNRAEIPPSVSAVCNLLGISSGFFSYSYPTLYKKLAASRTKALRRIQHMTARKMQRELRAHLYARYLSGELSSKDELVDQVVAICRVSKNRARRAVKAFEETSRR